MPDKDKICWPAAVVIGILAVAFVSFIIYIDYADAKESKAREKFWSSVKFYLSKEDGFIFNNDFYIRFQGTEKSLTQCYGTLKVLDASGKTAARTFFRTDWKPGEVVNVQIPVSEIKQPVQSCSIELDCSQGRTNRYWSY